MKDKMKKTKSFILFEDDDVKIRCTISINGNVIEKNRIIYKSDKKQCDLRYYATHKAHIVKYRQKNKAVIAEYMVDYRQKNKTRIAKCVAKYQHEHKIHIAECKVKYRRKNKAYIAKYHVEYYKIHKAYITEYQAEYQVEYQRENKEKICIYSTCAAAKRRSWGPPISINNWFKGSHLHHMHINGDHQICIYIPKELHKSIWHSSKDIKTMCAINKVAWMWFDSQPENYIDCIEEYDTYRDDILTEEQV